MKNIKACLSKASDDWATPPGIYDQLVKERGWFDPCPYNPDFIPLDGLAIPWEEYNFVNPPYSQIKFWVRKAIAESNLREAYSLLLVPARTDTKWFRELLDYGVRVWFITGRLKFNGKGCAPFPNCLILVGPHFEGSVVGWVDREKLVDLASLGI